MSAPRILVLDNYDSFTFNLVQYLGELGAELEVTRNDRVTVEEIAAGTFDGVVISPGPGGPSDAGISIALVEWCVRIGTPLLGVCLGHQAIAEGFGARIVRAPEVMHGKTSLVYHSGVGVLADLVNPFEAGRYHSLVVDKASIPAELRVTAWTDDGIVMGVRHTHRPVEGVQFHPESILTAHGMQLLANFLRSLSAQPSVVR